RKLEGDLGIVLSQRASQPTKGDSGAEVLQLLAPALLSTGTETLVVRWVRMIGPNHRVISYDQAIRGIPVLGSVSISLDVETRRMKSVVASFLPDRGLPKNPTLTAGDAKKALEKALVENQEAVKDSITL